MVVPSFWKFYSHCYIFLAWFAALDPARPQVSRILGEDVLSSADARLVQSFHSNAGTYGTYPAVPGAGHASYCLNGGRLQPTCGQGTRFGGCPAYCVYAMLNDDTR